MLDRLLRRIRELVRTSRYVMTVHGHEEMEADQLSIFDVEHCLLTGEIERRQRDRSAGEWKYTVRGETMSGRQASVVLKVGAS